MPVNQPPSSGAPSGAAGGDLTGTYPNPTVIANVALTGVPTVPTAAVDTNTTQAASTAMVLAQAASATPIIDGSATVGTSTRFARGDHIHPTDTTRAALASPTFTGTPAAPTPAAADNSTKLSTTAYVDTASGLLVPKSLYTTLGDIAVASGANTPVRLGIGSSGDILKVSSAASPTVAWGKPYGYYCRVAGTIADSFDRRYADTGAAATTATIMMGAIELEAGMVLSNFNIRTGGAAGSTLTNNWMALYDASRVQVASTADQGLASMAATTVFTWPIAQIASGASSTYTVPSSGLYYTGTMIKGTTPPNFNAKGVVAIATAPILYGTSNAAQAGVNAFPFTAAAITAAAGGAFYVWMT